MKKFITELISRKTKATQTEQYLEEEILKGISFTMSGNEMLFDFDKDVPSAKKILNFMKFFAETMQNVLHNNENIQNYLQLDLNDLSGRTLSLILVKNTGKSPHEIRAELEQKVLSLETELTDLRNSYDLIQKDWTRQVELLIDHGLTSCFEKEGFTVHNNLKHERKEN
ncbi:hypothetical protein CH380_19305 [Leptospira adleri]|uniref:Uncharacterized protein n=2 Tax=Leptospira adleri TaxID=2023186 RepID=A0A2M9YJ72_9LEPT|nr:hypothetical protein CH380_19305 [Leptospira adleri]PJZ61896.1 hypothetical protein CH376_10860 [Leptospira adleri]